MRTALRFCADHAIFATYPLFVVGGLALLFGAPQLTLAAAIVLLLVLAGWLASTLRHTSTKVDRMLSDELTEGRPVEANLAS